MNNSSISITQLLDTDLGELRKISREIWYSYYSTILSHAQIEYMLTKMYGTGVIENEIHHQGIFYDQVLHNSELVGYLSYSSETMNNMSYLKLHKCYLLPSLHGFGYGQKMLFHVYQKAQAMNLKQIILNVNKRNEKGIKAYSRFGFKIIDSQIKDFGSGFVLDDYIMGYDI
ncbi:MULTISPECIES: GNAT family N-acetyltransferase [Aphanizomenon]|uniref:GNAT family N-acetyltransferase n=1 Tax=Aphanizomenon TaxID=1175 RepID=UPI000541A411|nr:MULTISPECIES: GNAT family N-acetyltransferase [Aphanizomenon]MDK2408340.1 GNAT family N-acetyltransferase [Aphanizomenon sp. 202]MDK2459610.1 GNAT family N-acetyltransferase [Aphanizomenon sp. PH219]QSV71805.1 MAG: GNAT family N-acetyltransferase [Aphanizomenon flos-aquae KM1D3_PB]KHG42828.1 acetyltransferase [Aphanizomenon flos-aquae 2012/KM1/D3]MTJ29748.1 GNAT family N-acetyltransferase [Aphanizomenon sp. UHCC 0183]